MSECLCSCCQGEEQSSFYGTVCSNGFVSWESPFSYNSSGSSKCPRCKGRGCQNKKEE